MDANEFMIGNWIEFFEDGLLCRIIGIDKHGFRVYIPKTKEETCIEYDKFYPIPLTEEILDKIGFGVFFDTCPLELNPKHGRYLGRFEIFRRFENGNIIFMYPDVLGKYRDVLYVHQLQNLYYYFCGKDLKVELNTDNI